MFSTRLRLPESVPNFIGAKTKTSATTQAGTSKVPTGTGQTVAKEPQARYSTGRCTQASASDTKRGSIGLDDNIFFQLSNGKTMLPSMRWCDVGHCRQNIGAQTSGWQRHLYEIQPQQMQIWQDMSFCLCLPCPQANGEPCAGAARHKSAPHWRCLGMPIRISYRSLRPCPLAQHCPNFFGDRVQPIDLIHGHDLFHDDTFEDVLWLAVSGLIGAALAAPHCSKHSKSYFEVTWPSTCAYPVPLDFMPSNSPQSAAIHDRSRALLTEVDQHGGLVMENPATSMTFDDPLMVQWIQAVAPFVAQASACQFGKDRAKIWMFVIRMADGSFFSRLTAEYPHELASALATLIALGDPMVQLVWRWSCQRWQSAGGGSIPAGPLGSLKCYPPKGNGRRPKKSGYIDCSVCVQMVGVYLALPSTCQGLWTHWLGFDLVGSSGSVTPNTAVNCCYTFIWLQGTPLSQDELVPYIEDLLRFLDARLVITFCIHHLGPHGAHRALSPGLWLCSVAVRWWPSRSKTCTCAQDACGLESLIHIPRIVSSKMMLGRPWQSGSDCWPLHLSLFLWRHQSTSSLQPQQSQWPQPCLRVLEVCFFSPMGLVNWFQFKIHLDEAATLWEWVGSDMQKHIAAWELLAQYALTYCIHSTLPCCRNAVSCTQGTDNSAADAASAKGLSMTPAMATVLAPFFAFKRRYQIYSKITHIPGHRNDIADALSRFKQPLPEPLILFDRCVVR